MAGVTAARELRRAGLRVTVVEGRERVGGRVHTLRDFCERPVEAGAEFVHGARARTRPEAGAAGLHLRACPLLRDTMLNVGGGATRWLPLALVPRDVWPSFSILRVLGRLRPPDRSARAFLDERGYRGRARILAELTLTGHLPGTLDEVGVLGLVEDGGLALSHARNARVLEGYDRLPAALARGLDVRTGFEVERVSWAPDGVAVRARDGRTLEARAGVCTLPVGVLRAGRVAFEPALPRARQGALDHIAMGPVVKVLLRFEERFWPRRLATLACGRGPVTLYWPVFHGSEGPAVLSAYATGPRAAELGAAGEDEALDRVLADLCRHFPRARPRALLRDARRIDWARDPFALGGYTFLRPGGSGARERLAASDTGALVWAGSATQSQPVAASVEAAYLSGLRAAALAGRLVDAGAAA